MKTIPVRIATLFLCFSIYPVFPNALLQDVPRLTQEQSEWCWVATAKMTLDYYNKSPFMSQTDIAKYALGGVALNVPGYLGPGGPSGQKSVQTTLSQKKSLESTWTLGLLSMSDFAGAILGSRPVFVGVSYLSSSGSGHIVLGVGFDTQNGTNTNIGSANEITNVWYNDPETGTRLGKSFAAMRKNTDWEWDETLRLVTDGPTPPTGMHDNVFIENFTYNYYYPFTSKTATGRFYSNEVPVDHCYTFNWSIAFNHASGQYTAQSATLSGSDQSTWTISPFNLPTGYSWTLHPTGAVMGNLRVNCTDNGGYAHSDEKAVLFYSSGHYPVDVLYENKTTSTSQTDVKAHNWIGIQNDNLNAGTSINFRAGNAISIFDGTTIGNGATVNLSVEPSLR
jgi:hypothetical protein